MKYITASNLLVVIYWLSFAALFYLLGWKVALALLFFDVSGYCFREGLTNAEIMHSLADILEDVLEKKNG